MAGIIPATLDYDHIVQAVALDLSASSNRVYNQTYRAWADHCAEDGCHPLHLTPDAVIAFLSAKPTTKATRQRQLAALRKLADKLHTYALILAPQDAPRFEGLKKALANLKAPAPDRETQDTQERSKTALEPAQADKLLRVWHGDTDQHKRNKALIAVLLLSGIRRAEAVALRWQDVDFENGVLHIRHGKGDKARDAALAGDFAQSALRDWQMAQPVGRVYVFCAVERGGGIGKHDRPITGTDVYRILKATEKMTGIVFKPHDCRRTFITEGFNQGVPAHEIQAQAGHANASTTLHYAQATDARKRRSKLRFRYG